MGGDETSGKAISDERERGDGRRDTAVVGEDGRGKKDFVSVPVSVPEPSPPALELPTAPVAPTLKPAPAASAIVVPPLRDGVAPTRDAAPAPCS